MSADSTYQKGEETARGWRAKKYYLSEEAIDLLAAHCKGTPLTMSAWLDMTIKRELAPPSDDDIIAIMPSNNDLDEMRKLVEEGRRQLAELTGLSHRELLQAETLAQRARPGEYLGGEPPRSTKPKVNVRDIVRDLDEKQPTKKDFKVDI